MADLEIKQNNISLGYGIRRTPSLGEDGELSECVNLIPKGGELVNIPRPVEVGDFGMDSEGNDITIDPASRLLAIHDVGDSNHYVFALEGTPISGVLEGNIFLVPDSVSSVTVVGNTLVGLTDDGLYYWMYDEGEYRALGTTPELPILFKLDGDFRSSQDTAKIKFVAGSENNISFDTEVSKMNGTLNVRDYTGLAVLKKDESVPLQLVKGTKYRIVNHGASKLEFFYILGSYLGVLAIVPGGMTGEFTAYATADRFYVRGHNYQVSSCNYDFSIWTANQETISPIEVEESLDNTNVLMGFCNKWIHESMSDRGKFVMPFFARAAIELYDGTMVHHTIPCLMTPCSSAEPIIMIDDEIKLDGGKAFSGARIFGIEADLQYKLSQDALSELKNWRDIIKGIVIGVSAPIYRYDQGAEFEEGKKKMDLITGPLYSMPDYYCCGTIREDSEVTPSPESSPIAPSSMNDLIFKILNQQTREVNVTRIIPPRKDDKDYYEEYTANPGFYEIARINLDDIVGGEYTKVDLSEVDLTTITTRERLSDDYRSHDTISAKSLFSYNARLTASNITSHYWNGYNPFTCIGEQSSAVKQTYAEVTLNENGKKVVIECLPDVESGNYNLNWLFFPNENAESITFYWKSASKAGKFTAPLKKHTLLHGAYWFNNLQNLETLEAESTFVIPASVETKVSKRPTAIYTTDVNQPFTFPLSGRTSVGGGEVIGLSCAAKALSQGQFGQFPLYAFCTDGIWALSVGNDGSYVAKQPLSREVAIAGTLTQLDSAVLFVTKSGVKILQGSEVEKISAKVEGPTTGFLTLMNEIQPPLDVPDSRRFLEYIENAKIVYDYENELVHFFNEIVYTSTPGTKSVHYVYDLASGEFSKQVLPGRFVALSSGYPYTTIQMWDRGKAHPLSRIYQYKKTINEDRIEGIIVTRSCSLGNPLGKKALYDLRTLGQRVSKDTKFQVAVYISDDNVNWHRLTSLKMKSAKFYRFVVLTDMTDLETLSGISLTYQDRYNNKLR